MTWFTWLAQAQAPGKGPPPPLQPLPHPQLPEPVLVTPGLPWWIYAGAGVGILMLMGLVLWLLLRPQKARPLAPKQPWQTALNALRQLRDNASHIAPGEMGAKVSEVLRRYFLDRYNIPAPFRTTQEIFHRQELPPASQRLNRYAPLADLWDQLAFAPVPASTAEAGALVERAIAYLEEDRP
jgi:hypothetical protein